MKRRMISCFFDQKATVRSNRRSPFYRQNVSPDDEYERKCPVCKCKSVFEITLYDFYDRRFAWKRDPIPRNPRPAIINFVLNVY